MRNPFKTIFAIRREELPTALLMAGYFFLVITSFWILKPIKKSLFIGYYHASGQDGLELLGGPSAARRRSCWPSSWTWSSRLWR